MGLQRSRGMWVTHKCMASIMLPGRDHNKRWWPRPVMHYNGTVITTYRLWRGHRPANYKGPRPDKGPPRDNVRLRFYLKTCNLCFANRSIMTRMVRATRGLLDIKKSEGSPVFLTSNLQLPPGGQKDWQICLFVCPGAPLFPLLLSDPTSPGRHYRPLLDNYAWPDLRRLLLSTHAKRQWKTFLSLRRATRKAGGGGQRRAHADTGETIR